MRIATHIALALPLLAAAAAAQTTTHVVSLAGLRGNSRILLIFAPGPNDPQLQIQLRRLNDNAAAVTDRDLVPVAVPYKSPSPTPAAFTDDEALAARRRFQVDPGNFTVILIGKDGGEKLRSGKPLSINQLLDAIDSMPMRKEEMRSPPQP
jgi:hypothetical protein